MDDTTQPAAPARRGPQPNRAQRRQQSHRFRAAVASVNAAKRTGEAEPGTAGAAYLASERRRVEAARSLDAAEAHVAALGQP